MSKHKILITQSPFSNNGGKALNLLKKNNLSFDFNPFNRIMTEEEMLTLSPIYDIILSGTSSLNKNVINHFNKLKFIARAGIGYDNIDLESATKRNIKVANTPDAPTNAVAEFTIGLILNGLRGISLVDRNIKQAIWKKYFGYSLKNTTIGIIGVNRIGKRVIELLTPFSPKILAHDIMPDYSFSPSLDIEWKSKDEILKNADILSLHIPLTKNTINYIGEKELIKMKDSSMLINTSRGGIINEEALCKELEKGRFSNIALDVFNNEPYSGKLINYSNVILTSHIASATFDAIEAMEMGAVEEIIRFINNKSLKNSVN